MAYRFQKRAEFGRGWMGYFDASWCGEGGLNTPPYQISGQLSLLVMRPEA